MQRSTRWKLFLMMVLEFFIWGAWLPLIFNYLPGLGFSPVQQSWILNAFPLAAILGMFFGNQFADRNFAAEKFLAASHLIGGMAMIALAFTKSFWCFLGLMVVHCLFYVPTLSITNSIAFASMKDSQKEFGIVRMGGSLGWILAAWPFTFILADWDKVSAAHPHGMVNWLGTVLQSGLTGDALKAATSWTFIVAGVASLALAGFSFLLPHTPPRPAGNGAEKLAWFEAVKLLKHPFVLVLWIVTLVDSFVQNSYFNWARHFSRHDQSRGRRGHSRQLDNAGDECGADRGNPHHVRAGRNAEAARLACYHDRRDSRPRGTVCGLCIFPAINRVDHRGADAAWNLLRVLLCHGLHLC